MKNTLFTIALIALFVCNVKAQETAVKFGKIEKSELEMSTYEKDTSAAAVILYDFGNSYFIYTEEKGFKIVFERHTRIKIFGKNGYKLANVSIPFYKNMRGSEEDVSGLKAFTYNLEKGKISKDKLANNAIFEEQATTNWSNVKFTMPNVKEGSIIEYKYTITSDFIYNFKDWQFQHSVPVVWSEYSVEIPEYFNYSQTQKGYESLAIIEKNKTLKKYTYTYQSSRDNSNRIVPGGTSEFEVLTNNYRWVAKDLQAFKEEKYMSSSENFLTKMEFELLSTKYPNRTRDDYSKTWESINIQLMEHEKFGHQFSGDLLAAGSSFIKDEVESIKNKCSNDEEKMLAAFEFVKNYMKWNGSHRMYVDESLRKAYKEKSGSSADINLLLIVMLKKLDLNADPVVLSTRNNGVIHPAHPALTRFNYVVASVNINDNMYMLDATDPLYTINMLPFKCLNGRGRIVNKEKTDWVNLYTKNPKSTVSMFELAINDNGSISGKSQSSFKGYAALEFRKTIAEAISQEIFIEEFERDNNGLDVKSFAFENLNDVYKPVIKKYEVAINDQVEVIGDMMYFTPMLYRKIEENPFKLENRLYPVDYGYTITETNIYKYTIPEDYMVDEKPESVVLSLPNNDGRFTFNVVELGNVIQITSKFSINKTLFIPEEYQALKMFYNKIIAKHAEQIILKKKEE